MSRNKMIVARSPFRNACLGFISLAVLSIPLSYVLIEPAHLDPARAIAILISTLLLWVTIRIFSMNVSTTEESGYIKVRGPFFTRTVPFSSISTRWIPGSVTDSCCPAVSAGDTEMYLTALSRWNTKRGRRMVENDIARLSMGLPKGAHPFQGLRDG